MDWLLANPQIQSTFASLGSMQDDTYIVSDNCLAILEEINCKLLIEDHTLRTFRRAIGFGQNVKNDLIPLLVFAKCSKILDATIRILVNLTVPVECLLNVDVMSRTETGRHTMFEVSRLLITCKESFTDSRTTKAVIDYMKGILEKDLKISIEDCNSLNNCLLLLRNILHIPQSTFLNYHGLGSTSMQNQLVWNLFTQSIDKLLLYFMSCPQKSYCGVTMVQLIALMYKDQHVNTLQKLLNIWFDASISESSEDNESNTSPQKQCSGDSSPMLTSDPTSDSSDNGGSGKGHSNDDRMHSPTSKDSESLSFQRINSEFQAPILRVKPNPIKNQTAKEREQIVHADAIKKQQQNMLTQTKLNNFNPPKPQRGKKRECPSSQSELSDCGYGTQVENQESISTSSNEDDSPKQKPIHHPPCNQKHRYNASRNNTTISDKKELRRKKLVKRSRSNIINMKGLLHHTPTDEDISNILKEFTVDFLLKGYGNLVDELHAQLLTDLHVQIDTSHFFWLVTYFLKFAAQLELELEHINSVLSYDVVSYLTYEGFTLCEQLELATYHQGSDLKPCLRRMHLVVTAIREFLQALETYTKISHLSLEDKEYLRNLQCQIGATEDLKNLFILLLRKYDPAIQSKQYLQDLIVTNHILLLLLDNVSNFSEFRGQTKMLEHIKQFATVEIMTQYGLLLEDFRENGEFVNDCIFTMMHHIGGDLGQSSTLFQPVILKTYSQIWETEYELCDDWSDLIEYVIHKFINTPQQSSLSIQSPQFNLNEYGPAEHMEISVPKQWTQEEMDSLYWYYVQSKKSRDTIGKIIKLFNQNGVHTIKSRLAVIQQLLQQDIITLLEYDELMKYEDENFERSIRTPSSSTGNDNESGIEMKDSLPCTSSKSTDDVQVLRDRLLKEGKGNLILWLQKILIESCFVKLSINSEKLSSSKISGVYENKIMEPVPYQCTIKKQSIPVIPLNSEQSNILVYQPFVLLLHKLGFHLPADAGKLFVRIPEFWTADILYNVALKLGPINKSFLKFDPTQLKQAQETSIFSVDQADTQEYFALPRSKKANSMVRFTPDTSVLLPIIPNWLNIIMRSKNRSENSILFGGHLYTSSIQQFISATTATQTTDILQTTSSPISTSTIFDSNLMIVAAENYSKSSTNLQNIAKEYEAKQNDSGIGVTTSETSSVTVINMEEDASETASIASDLTRMYVSDEEDKAEQQIRTLII